ncbi:MAG: hypothetical protein LBE58_13795, partial [Comamonas sp.]|nr:hypothetical protein [Comamonas sp.]
PSAAAPAVTPEQPAAGAGGSGGSGGSGAATPSTGSGQTTPAIKPEDVPKGMAPAASTVQPAQRANP